MNRVYCDICGKEMPAEDYHDEIMGYDDFLKNKGEGALIVRVERVVKGKGEDHYYTREYDWCPECQAKVDLAVMKALGSG